MHQPVFKHQYRQDVTIQFQFLLQFRNLIGIELINSDSFFELTPALVVRSCIKLPRPRGTDLICCGKVVHHLFQVVLGAAVGARAAARHVLLIHRQVLGHAVHRRRAREDQVEDLMLPHHLNI